MKDIIDYLKAEVKARNEHVKYCVKYEDDRQAKYHRENIERLNKCISILNNGNKNES